MIEVVVKLVLENNIICLNLFILDFVLFFDDCFSFIFVSIEDVRCVILFLLLNRDLGFDKIKVRVFIRMFYK